MKYFINCFMSCILNCSLHCILKYKSTLLFIALPLLINCQSDTGLSDISAKGSQSEEAIVNQTLDTITFAQFNVSFAHDGDPQEHFEQWVYFMNMPHSQQNKLLRMWRAGQLHENDKKLAERIIQIRNIAAIIQSVRPDVLLLNEFNNDGEGKRNEALKGFNDNYLAISQSINSVDGGARLDPISYPYLQNFATNTGLPSGMDLNHNGNNNGYSESDPNDAYGFGFYHGHYAFTLFSKYEIDSKNIRTFQRFKRSDLPGATQPIINVRDDEKPLPKGKKCGDNWFTDEQWKHIRLSSKNHVDAPIIVPSQNGTVTIHALLSHPTPPAFDTFSDNNKYRNSEENLFWLHYISRDNISRNNIIRDNNTRDDIQKGDFIYDDKGKYGGLDGEHFVIMGDLNADAQVRTGADERFDGIRRLMSHPLLNQAVSQADGKFAPTSIGGAQANARRPHPIPETRTSTFGVRADYSVPSATLEVLDSGVFWAAEDQPGRLLFNDARVGKYGNGKEISSDHRLVWVTVKIP